MIHFRRVMISGLLVLVLGGCQSTEEGYDWSPGDDIQTNASGEVVVPDAIVLPEEDIEAINKL
ncbi:hypothetical protein [Photobacterium sp. BZF1]|uniref:hypothetical protein n=1 Tax=Photobacterium sp. BZF1 TaxID=1904457 RepID=UPI001CA3ABAE|nr:hypothetical protein [Photobacterium sp. BZF1]